MVQRLEGHACRHAAVADQRDRHVRAALMLHGAGHAERGRNRSARVAGAEGVVRRLGAAQELRDAPFLADAREVVAASGQQLVRVALVADVEHQLVARRVEDGVDRGDQLDGAEARGQVPARARDVLDDLLAQLGATCATCSRERRRRSSGARMPASRRRSLIRFSARRSAPARATARRARRSSRAPRAPLEQRLGALARAARAAHAQPGAGIVAAGVQRIVRDLERDADALREATQMRDGVGVARPPGARRPRSPPRTAPRSCARAPTRSPPRPHSLGSKRRSSTCPPTRPKAPPARASSRAASRTAAASASGAASSASKASVSSASPASTACASP